MLENEHKESYVIAYVATNSRARVAGLKEPESNYGIEFAST